MNFFLGRKLSLEGFIALGVASAVGLTLLKDSKLAKDEIDKRTSGPGAAGLAAAGGLLLGNKIFSNSYSQTATFAGRTLPVSKGLVRTLGVAGLLSATAYAVGEKLHYQGAGPEVLIPAAAKVGLVTVAAGLAYNKGLDYLEREAQVGFLRGLKETADRELVTKANKLFPILSKINISKQGVARVLTAFTVVGATRKIEAQSIRNARNNATESNESGAYMTPQEYSNEIEIEEIREARNAPLLDIRLNQEGFVDKHALAQSLLK